MNYNTFILVNEVLNSVGAIGLQVAATNLTQDILMSKKLNGDDIRIAKETSQIRAADTIVRGRTVEKKKEIRTKLKSLRSDLLRHAKEFLELTYELEELEKVTA